MDLLTQLLSGNLHWRNATWLWALVLPILLWIFNRLAQAKQQQRYADSHLWPWVKASSPSHDIKKSSPPNASLFKSITVYWPQTLWHICYSPSRFITFAWFCLVIAMAGPRSLINAPDLQNRAGVDVLVSVDLSQSMSAEDRYPNRFLFAKSLIESMNNQLEKNDRIALQAFAGQAHIVTPLTYDRTLFQHNLNLLEPNLLPLQGSWIERAIINGFDHLSDTGGKAKVMVIFTNGAPEFQQPVSLPKAEQKSPFATPQSPAPIKLILVGIGQTTAINLPDPNHITGKLYVNGTLVTSRLEESRLKKIAQQRHGVYLRAESSQHFMQQLLQEITLPAASRPQLNNPLIWKEHAHPFIVAGFLTLLLAFYLFPVFNLLKTKTNRPINQFTWLTGGLIALLLYSPHTLLYAQVTPPTSITLQQAYQAYQNQNYALAQSLYNQVPSYQGQFGAGASAYQLGDMEAAVLYFRQSSWLAQQDKERARALFNLGNSYYQANLLDFAIESYRQALVYQPDYPKARHNLTLAKQKKQLPQKSAQQKGQQGEGEGSKGQENEGAFYGGQKPNTSQSQDAGFGSDGDAPEGTQQGQHIIIPKEGDSTLYQLNSVSPIQPIQNRDFSSQPNQALQTNLIFIQQQKQQHAEQFKYQLQQLEDNQKNLLKRIFEREAGFHAPQKKPHPIPGIQPW